MTILFLFLLCCWSIGAAISVNTTTESNSRVKTREINPSQSSSSSSTKTTTATAPRGLCSILGLFPYTLGERWSPRGSSGANASDEQVQRWTTVNVELTGYSYAAAALLAMDQFNARDASIVSQVLDISDDCDFIFSTNNTGMIVDTGFDSLISGKAIIDSVGSRDSNVCSIIGPYDPAPADLSSAITASLDIPQLLYSSQAKDITNPDFVSNTVRLTLSPAEYAKKILSYLSFLKRDYVLVAFGSSPYDLAVAGAIATGAPPYGIEVTMIAFPAPPPRVDLQTHYINIFNDIALTGIRTIIRINEKDGPADLLEVSSAAETAGVLENDYVWILEEKVAPVEDLDEIFGVVDVKHPLHKLLSGAIVITSADGYGPQGSKFLNSWRMQDADFAHRVNQLIPGSKPMQGAFDFFKTHDPRRGSIFVYDAVMSVGFGACNAQVNSSSDREDKKKQNPEQKNLRRWNQEKQQSNKQQQNEPSESEDKKADNDAPKEENSSSNSNKHVLGIMGSVFDGASGTVKFGTGRRQQQNRIGSNVAYGAYNIRPIIDDVESTATYEIILVSHSTENGKTWKDMPGESIIYRDGTSQQPQPALVYATQNFIPGWARGVGLALMMISSTLSFILLCALWIWKDKPRIRAGQPPFLFVLCVGSLLTGASIFTLSLDEGFGANDRQLDNACIATPWLFFLGITSMFTGLFCKLWRVEQLTQFRKRKVEAMQVMWPLLLVLSSTVVCLVAWTIISPWTWERDVLPVSPPETYGQCKSKHFGAFFSTLCGMMIVATSAALVMAWKTKNVNIDSRFTDSNAVFLAIGSQLQAWFVGLPILAVLRESSVEATYLGRVLLIWLFAMAPLLLVVAPKVMLTWHEIRTPLSPRKCSVHVSGLDSMHNGTQAQSTVTLSNPDNEVASS